MKGKDKCKILKEIRAQIAEANEIEWVTETCTHKGDCRGTCPKCESEVRALESALARRKALGKTVAVAGLAAGLVVSSSACELMEVTETAGDMIGPDGATEQTSKYTATGEAGAIETEVTVEIDGDMVDVTAGVPIQRYYYADFVLQERARPFEMNTDCYVYAVCTAEETDCTDGIVIPAGARFDVIGEMSDYELYLIDYERASYCIFDYELTEFAHELEPTEAGE